MTKPFCTTAVLLVAILCILFRGAIFHHNNVVFSNDGPLGALAAKQAQTFGNIWADLNYLGKADPAWGSMLTTAGFRAFLSIPILMQGCLLTLIVFPIGFWLVRKDFWLGTAFALRTSLLAVFLFGVFLALAGLMETDQLRQENFMGMGAGLLNICFLGLLFEAPLPAYEVWKPGKELCQIDWPSSVVKWAWTISVPLLFWLLGGFKPSTALPSDTSASAIAVSSIGLMAIGFLLSHLFSKTKMIE